MPNATRRKLLKLSAQVLSPKDWQQEGRTILGHTKRALAAKASSYLMERPAPTTGPPGPGPDPSARILGLIQGFYSLQPRVDGVDSRS